MTSRPTTLGALRASGHQPVPVKEEMRRNALRLLREGQPLFTGIVGYERSVVPALANALLARHDFILLGLRGQAKTRLVRQLVRFLDDAVPAIEGSPLLDHPLAPVSAVGRRLVAEAGDDTPVRWVGPDERYLEKLATPDVTIADLIGDIDPIRAANEGLNLDDERVIQYGLVPRAHRGIFAINELPDLAPRIQVGLLNILEEKDVQVRGFALRLPLDVAMVFTANPEDYTNRGSIITPLKDRIDSQIQTHYPQSLGEAMAITDGQAWTEREVDITVPGFVREVVDRAVMLARESDHVDHSSGVSARAGISGLEVLLSNVERRLALQPGSAPVARLCDLDALVPALVGKLELAYEGEQEGAWTVCRDLVGKAVKQVFLAHFPDPGARSGRKEPARGEGAPEGPRDRDPGLYREVVAFFGEGGKVELADDMPDDDYRTALMAVPGLEELAREHMSPDDDELLPAMELVLEGLYQSSFVAKENLDRSTLYSDMLLRMFQGMGGGGRDGA